MLRLSCTDAMIDAWGVIALFDLKEMDELSAWSGLDRIWPMRLTRRELTAALVPAKHGKIRCNNVF
jgi:hypothetical protein